MVRAPWNEDQVASLNGWQNCPYVHPFTGDHGPDEEPLILIATTDGWVEREGGPVVQTWAHEFMADWSWKTTRMASVRQTVLQILKENKGSMSLVAISRALIRLGVLGFGVEPIDVISALMNEGKVELVNDQVTLVKTQEK